MKLSTTVIIGALLGLVMLLLTDSALAEWEKPRAPDVVRNATAEVDKSGGKTPTRKVAYSSQSKKAPAPKVREEPPILAGAAIKVVRFNSGNRTLEVKIIDEPAVGPNITKPESLLAAVGFEDEGDRKRFMEEPRRFVGAEYTLKSDLELIAPETLKKK